MVRTRVGRRARFESRIYAVRASFSVGFGSVHRRKFVGRTSECEESICSNLASFELFLYLVGLIFRNLRRATCRPISLPHGSQYYGAALPAGGGRAKACWENEWEGREIVADVLLQAWMVCLSMWCLMLVAQFSI